MNKKEICENNHSFAYWSGCGGVELKRVEYGVNDYIYCISNAWSGKKSYHRLKVYHDNDGGFLVLHGYKIPLNECIKISLI